MLLAVFCLVFICAQVYFTFSGYSDMARGMMYMLGIPHAPDILSPFAATSPADYLRRFFVSMSRWIEDYLVYPILRTCRIPARHSMFSDRGYLLCRPLALVQNPMVYALAGSAGAALLFALYAPWAATKAAQDADPPPAFDWTGVGVVALCPVLVFCGAGQFQRGLDLPWPDPAKRLFRRHPIR